jgi:hypothetical protein
MATPRRCIKIALATKPARSTGDPRSEVERKKKMSRYNPPHGALDFLLANSAQSKRYVRENQQYRGGYHRAKGARDANRK